MLGDWATDLSKLGTELEDGKTDQPVNGQPAHPAKMCVRRVKTRMGCGFCPRRIKITKLDEIHMPAAGTWYHTK